MPTTLSPDKTTEALAAVLAGVYGPETAEQKVAALDRLGWTADRMTRLVALTERAVATRAPATVLGAEWHWVPGGPVAHLTYGTTCDINFLVQSDVSFTIAFAWAAVTLTAPTGTEVQTLTRLLYGDATGPGCRTRAAWLDLGVAGALAWAAGLTLGEALTRALGDAEEQNLRLLAGLRGWALPDLP